MADFLPSDLAERLDSEASTMDFGDIDEGPLEIGYKDRLFLRPYETASKMKMGRCGLNRVPLPVRIPCKLVGDPDFSMSLE